MKPCKEITVGGFDTLCIQGFYDPNEFMGGTIPPINFNSSIKAENCKDMQEIYSSIWFKETY